MVWLVQTKGSNGKRISLLFASSKGLQGSDMESRRIAGGDGKSNSFVDLGSASANILTSVVSGNGAGEVTAWWQPTGSGLG